MQEPVGYADTVNGEVYCSYCVVEDDKTIFSPIYSHDEWDYAPCCNECHAELDVCVLNPENRKEITIGYYCGNYTFIDKYSNIDEALTIRRCEKCRDSLDWNYCYIMNKLTDCNLLTKEYKDLCCHCQAVVEYNLQYLKTLKDAGASESVILSSSKYQEIKEYINYEQDIRGTR